MAITNAQQYQQLVNPPMKGKKRPGYRGSDMGGVAGDSRAANTGAKDTSGADYGGGNQGMDRSGPDDRGTAAQNRNQRNVVREGRIREAEKLINRPTVRERINRGLTNLRNRNIKKFIDRSIRKDLFRSGFVPNAFMGINIPTTAGILSETGYSLFGPEVDLFDEDSLREIASTLTNTGGSLTKSQSKALESFGKNIANRDEFLEKGMTQKRFEELYPKPTVDDRDGPQDPCRGPNPPAYCFVGIRSAAPVVEEEPEYVNPLSKLTPRIAGTQFAAEGGRIGLRGGDAARSDAASGRNAGRADPSGGVDRPGGGGDGPKGPPTNVDKGSGGVTTLKSKKNIPTTNTDFMKFSTEDLINMGLIGDENEDMQLAKTYSTGDIEKLLGIKDQKTAEKFVEDPITSSPKFIDDKSQANIMEKFRENLLEQETKFPGKPFDAQRAGALSFGISPTNQSLVPSDFLDKPGEAATQMPFSTIAKEIEAKYPMAEGGIASLEDMDREGFLLGGIAKGLKKAVKGVKKLAKSPIGKAALGFAALKYGGGLGGIMDKFNSLNKLQKFGVGIGVPSILAGLMTPKQDEDKFDIDAYYAANQLNPSQSIRGMGSEFDFYGGQRIASAEGGATEKKEPVAKKVMPLIDMDGKEKDYRETGGFVDMGRMEKADDVPARLSKNEFVFTADAVRNAGDGSIDKGSEVMYNMMKNLESGGDVSEESQGLNGARKMFQTSQRLEEVL